MGHELEQSSLLTTLRNTHWAALAKAHQESLEAAVVIAGGSVDFDITFWSVALPTEIDVREDHYEGIGGGCFKRCFVG